MPSPLFTGSEWTFPLIKSVYDEIEKIAVEELKLTTYPNQIEIISSDQMLDCYASIGLPMMYNHWSFGKHFIREEFKYRKGMSGLAYEIVINSVPTISYLMEENSMTMQTLVLAHAAQGHNSFFRNNYMFKQWTDAEGILDYLSFAKKYVAKCEERYGVEAVERTLDSCHALRNHGVDRYRRPGKLSAELEEKKQQDREMQVQADANDLWRTLPTKKGEAAKPETVAKFPKEPEENLLRFIEKYSPTLEGWQREVVRIVRKLAQYFYPQAQTQVMNEGWACFTHYYIMTRLHEKGLIDDGSFMEFLHSHSSVTFQPDFDDQRYSGINPYHLGFHMFTDLRRICEFPTDEDREWFPDIAGMPWLETLHYAMENFRDESFIQQFLSPHLIRAERLIMADDKSSENFLTIERIHNERGYKALRQRLSRNYALARREPDIQVVDSNLLGDRTLKLRHTMYDSIKLGDQTREVLKHLIRLWGYKVEIEMVDIETGKVSETIALDSST